MILDADNPSPTTAMPPHTVDHAAAGEPDVEFEYHWREGSVPPPQHYRYDILGSTAGQGRIEFVPGYDGPGTPTWVEPFMIDAGRCAALIVLLQSRQVLHRSWHHGLPGGVGGSQRRLRFRCGERQIELPAEPAGDDAALADALAQAIVAVVPEPVWIGLRQRHAAFVAARG